MMKPIFCTLTLLLLAACGPDVPHNTGGRPNDAKHIETMKRVADSLQRQLDEQEAKRREAEELAGLLNNEPSDSEEIPIAERTGLPAPKKSTPASGATYHYFTGTKKVSVGITPWKERRRSVICYDKKGNVTYTFDDVQLSYSEITEVLSFHPNGAAKTIEQRSNPGGSRYLPKTTYTFDEENYPLRSEYDDDEGTVRMPSEYVKTWDRASKSWK